MANYATLKSTIEDNIKQNGVGAITGPILQSALLSMINSLGAGYQFAGTAQLDTNPGTPDARVFYFPTQPGTYPNFGGLQLAADELALFYYNGSWLKSLTLNIYPKDVITANLKRYITFTSAFDVNNNVIDFGEATFAAFRNIDSSDPIIITLTGTYTFSTGITPDYLIAHDDGTIDFVSGASNVGTTDTVLLSYWRDNNMYFGLLADQVNAKLNRNLLGQRFNILPPNSLLDNNTPLRQSGAGLWGLRTANQGNSVTKQDGYFHFEVSRVANPALWITKLNLSPYLGQALRVSFSIKTTAIVHFIVGGESEIVVETLNEWVDVSETVYVGNSYGDFRIMLYSSAASTFSFDIKNVAIVDPDNVRERHELYLQLNSKYFEGDGLLAGKKLSVLGDSISTFGVPDQSNANGMWTYPGNRCRYPQSNLFTEVNECYWKRLIDKYGMFLGINESWAGSRVSNTQETDSGDFGPNRCISSQTRIGHLGNNGTPDIILVYGGTNDAGGGVTLGTFNTENPINYTDEQIAALPVATFADAYRAMLIRLLKTYPTARIIVMLPNFTTSYYAINNLDTYIEVIKEECDYFGIKYVDIRTAGITVYNQGTYFPDGIHPNAAGMDLLFKLLCRDVFDGLNKNGL